MVQGRLIRDRKANLLDQMQMLGRNPKKMCRQGQRIESFVRQRDGSQRQMLLEVKDGFGIEKV